MQKGGISKGGKSLGISLYYRSPLCLEPPMKTPTFGESFCARHDIPPEQFPGHVFKRSLYRRARPFVWLLRFLRPNYFAADFDLIYGVEHLRRLRDFTTEVERFNEHPANRGWLRRQLCIRISSNRLKQVIRETLPSSSARRGASGPASASFESRVDSNADLMALTR